MPELRKDPVIGRWVIIATDRARRPGNFVDPPDIEIDDEYKDCPFCQEQNSPIYAASLHGDSLKQNHWDVCVIPSRKLANSFELSEQRARQGLYDVVSGFGPHEVVIETPKHIANMADLEVNQIELVLQTYVDRINELKKNKALEHVLVYKNYGSSAGSRKIGHSRSHIIGTSVCPLRVKEKLKGAKEYYAQHQKCVYCALLDQELRDRTRIVVETDHFVAVTPFAGRFLFELCILPKNHHHDFSVGVRSCIDDLAQLLKILLRKFQVGLDDPAYNFVIHTGPVNREKSSTNKWETIERDYHWHIELMPRLTNVAGFEKGTGFYICSIPPEDMAEYLRDVKIGD